MRIKRGSQDQLPLLGGSPTNLGYSTIMYGYRPPEKKRAVELAKEPRRVMTERRRHWMQRLLNNGPTAWPGRRTSTPDACMALGWTEWAKDGRGSYLYDMSIDPPRVRERLTQEGMRRLGELAQR